MPYDSASHRYILTVIPLLLVKKIVSVLRREMYIESARETEHEGDLEGDNFCLCSQTDLEGNPSHLCY